MKKNYLLIMCLSLLSVATSVTKADHNSPVGSVAKLQAESRELLQFVNSSWLNYNVKDSVYRFSSDVDRLASCVEREAIADNHLEEPGCPYQCRYYLNYANNSFRTVSNYLYDTYYDFPQVYQQWRETERALNSIHVNPSPNPYPPTPQPPQQMIKCVATDTGWEEHSGGHVAYGRELYSTQRYALNECRRFHSSCKISYCQNQ